MGKHKKSKREERKYKFLRGIPHCHSSYSTGEGSPNDVYKAAKESDFDFLILTDHHNILDDKIKYRGKLMTKWEASAKQAEDFIKKNDNFLPLLGFEADTYWGHINVFNSKSFFKGAVKNIDNLNLWCINSNCVLTINHPHSNVEKLALNSITNNYLTLVEICNGIQNGKYQRYEKRFYKLLDSGWKLGAINSQDNHKINFHQNDNVTIALCNNFSKEALMEAFRARRVYSSESKSLKLLFSINDAFMGEDLEVKEKEYLKFKISLRDDKNDIEKIQIISNKGKVIKDMSFPSQEKVSYSFKHKPNEKENWYMVKIYQKNNKIAYSSPIFIC